MALDTHTPPRRGPAYTRGRAATAAGRGRRAAPRAAPRHAGRRAHGARRASPGPCWSRSHSQGVREGARRHLQIRGARRIRRQPCSCGTKGHERARNDPSPCRSPAGRRVVAARIARAYCSWVARWWGRSRLQLGGGRSGRQLRRSGGPAAAGGEGSYVQRPATRPSSDPVRCQAGRARGRDHVARREPDRRAGPHPT